MNGDKELSKQELELMIKDIYGAICEKGFDPATQIAGYILSEDPVYISNWKNARGMVRHINRDELLRVFIEYYFENRFKE